jgi:hypothetical protein
MNNRSVPNLEERLKHASEAEKLMLAKFKTSLVEGRAAIEKRQQRDHKVYFCRSDLNPADYIIWVRAANALSYLFLTDSGLKLIRAVHLKTAAFPEVLDVPTARIQAICKNALVALGQRHRPRALKILATGQPFQSHPLASDKKNRLGRAPFDFHERPRAAIFFV